MTTSIFLRRDQAAAYLKEKFGVGTRQMLARLACAGGGPLYRKLGHYPVYTREDLDSWFTNRLSAPMASTSHA